MRLCQPTSLTSFAKPKGKRLFTSLIATTFLVGCGSEPVEETATLIRPVFTEPAATVVLNSQNQFYGEVQSANRAEMGFRTGGRIAAFFVDEGDQVLKGDLLATLDPTDAQITLSRAEIDQENTRREYLRAKQLFDNNGAIAKAELDQIESSYLVAQNRVKEAQRQLKHTNLYAHFDGVIARRTAEDYDLVQAEQTVLTMHDLDNLEVVIQIPASVMQTRGGSGKAYATLRTIPGQVFDLSLSRYATEPDPVTHTYAITLTFDDIRDERVFPGMAVTVTPNDKFEDQAQSVMVPVTAVQPNNMGQQFVWVVNSDNQLERREVEVGGISVEQVEIIANLTQGEQVVVAGLAGLTEGMAVRAQQLDAEGAK
ncbi:efflux RND transporter periplasmic adaptor subunit [Agarivorans sp. JK6]|uniref:efflux RND transporter periplasmic adaptor subunit n=1 Tax=Agarivorans sp. JK6 TaxID=2997426 RepID=UPI003872DD65